MKIEPLEISHFRVFTCYYQGHNIIVHLLTYNSNLALVSGVGLCLPMDQGS